MMNPPDRLCYELVIQVNESCTLGTIVSFKNVLDKTSSISSGALADHSSLSESSENCSATFPLPRTSRSEEHLSASTSSSSGLSVSQNLLKSAARSVKPCFSKVKIVCNCSRPGCESHSPIKLTNGETSSTEIAENADAGQNIEPCHSDMDLTDPLGRSSAGEPDPVPRDRKDVQPEAPGAEPTQSEESFPQIPLSLRPSCQHEAPPPPEPVPGPSSAPDPQPPLIRLAFNLFGTANLDREDEEDEEEEDEVPAVWDWTSNLPELICFDEKLDESERRPEIPTHFVEDDNSVLFGMVWLILTEHARTRSELPPCLTTRIFHDPAVTDYPWPKHVTDCFAKMTDRQINAIYEDFIRVRDIAYERYPHLKPKNPRKEDVAQEIPDSPEVYEVLSDGEYHEEHPVDETAEFHAVEEEPGVAENLEADSREKASPTASSRKRINDDPVCTSSTPPTKKARTSSPRKRQPTPTVVEPSHLLVYAKCDKWYYPGVVDCSLDQWDSTVKPLKVTFCDGEEKDLAPDLIFPMSRLPPGAQIQRQSDESIYEDVFFLSSSYSVSSSGVPSARILVQDPEEGTTEEITFDNSALSPKDVIRLRSALKQQFYPSRARQNFTEVSEGAILFTQSRRTRNADTKPPAPKSEKHGPESQAESAKAQPSSATSKTDSAKPADGHAKPATTAQPAKKASSVATPSTEKPRKRSRQASVTKNSTGSNVKHTVHKTDEQLQEYCRYRCLGEKCLMAFKSSMALKVHQRKMAKNKKRNHEGMGLVYQCDFPGCSAMSAVAEQFKYHLSQHNQQTQSGSKQYSPAKAQPFTKPSVSGTGVGVRRGSVVHVPSDTDTDTSPLFRKCSRPSGAGLQNEMVVLGDCAKSFTALKNTSRNEATSDIFKGYNFVLTKGIDNRSPTTSKRSRVDSESDSTDLENYYQSSVKFDVAALQRLIEVGGGKLFESVADLPDDPQTEDPNEHTSIVVSNHPCTTPNYIHGLALGLTMLQHDTILECAKKGVSLRSVLTAGNAALLSPGWDNSRNMWVTPRASKVRPLVGLTVMTVLRDHEFWHYLIRQMGGRALEWLTFAVPGASGVFAVVADHSISEEKRQMAKVRRLPLVTTDWLVQALVTGREPLVYDYELPSPPTTS